MTSEGIALSDTLRAARRSRGLSVLAVAERLGIPRPIYKLIETGKLHPDRERLRAICDFFELEPPMDP